MIKIERIYDPKDEFKLLFKSLRFLAKQPCQQSHQNKIYLEYDLTELIDCFVLRWKYEKINPVTYAKLHRFAIAFRHNVLNNGTQKAYKCVQVPFTNSIMFYVKH